MLLPFYWKIDFEISTEYPVFIPFLPCKVTSLETDLKDGLLLIDLLEKLAAPNKVGRYNKNPKQKVQMIENLGSALRFIYAQDIKLVNIGKQNSFLIENLLS